MAEALCSRLEEGDIAAAAHVREEAERRWRGRVKRGEEAATACIPSTAEETGVAVGRCDYGGGGVREERGGGQGRTRVARGWGEAARVWVGVAKSAPSVPDPMMLRVWKGRQHGAHGRLDRAYREIRRRTLAGTVA